MDERDGGDGVGASGILKYFTKPTRLYHDFIESRMSVDEWWCDDPGNPVLKLYRDKPGHDIFRGIEDILILIPFLLCCSGFMIGIYAPFLIHALIWCFIDIIIFLYMKMKVSRVQRSQFFDELSLTGFRRDTILKAHFVVLKAKLTKLYTLPLLFFHLFVILYIIIEYGSFGDLASELLILGYLAIWFTRFAFTPRVSESTALWFLNLILDPDEDIDIGILAFISYRWKILFSMPLFFAYAALPVTVAIFGIFGLLFTNSPDWLGPLFFALGIEILILFAPLVISWKLNVELIERGRSLAMAKGP